MIMNQFEDKGILRSNLSLGIISTVRSYLAHVNLYNAGDPSGFYYEGARYGRGEVGEIVVIESQQNLLLGKMIEVRLPDSERRIINEDYSGTNSLYAIGHVQLLGTIAMDNLHVTAGVDSYPRLGDRVYSAPHDFIARIPELTTIKKEDTVPKIRLNLGRIKTAHETKVRIIPEKLFGRHCAILGATGGGKSWTTARIVEECLNYESKIIIIDATAEYRGMMGKGIVHYHLGSPVVKSHGSIESFLPPTCFTESDFIALFEPSGKVQGPKLKAAIRSLRLAKIKSSLAQNGFIPKIGCIKKPIEDAEQDPETSAKLEDPRQPFDVRYLVTQIEHECVWPTDKNNPGKWGREDGNFSYCLSLVARINGILSSPAFKCVFASDNPSLTGGIDEYIEGKENLMRICLSGVAHEYKAREIVTNVIGRYLLDKARSGAFKSKPLIVILDEAHNFLGRHIGGEDYSSKLDAFELIAKEGRKYGLSICLATQRPRDITEGVLSQIGTLLVHRLTNDRDREVVERACSEIDRSVSSFLPNLAPGELVIIGVDFPIPLTIKISQPENRPISDGSNFQECWSPRNGN